MHARLKMVGASLLLISLGLPLQRTTHFVDPDLGVQQVYRDRTGTVQVAPEGQPLPQGATPGSDTYAIERGNPMNWFFVLVFTWPAIAVAVIRWRRRGLAVLGARILEPPLLAGSYFMIDFASTFSIMSRSHRGPGGLLALAALGLYAAGALWSDAASFRDWRRQRQVSEVTRG